MKKEEMKKHTKEWLEKVIKYGDSFQIIINHYSISAIVLQPGLLVREGL